MTTTRKGISKLIVMSGQFRILTRFDYNHGVRTHLVADHLFSANLKEEAEFCPFGEDNDEVDNNEDEDGNDYDDDNNDNYDHHHHPDSRGVMVLINVGISYIMIDNAIDVFYTWYLHQQ